MLGFIYILYDDMFVLYINGNFKKLYYNIIYYILDTVIHSNNI